MKGWWLLALCGVFDAMFSVMSFVMQRPDGSLALRTGVHRGSIVDMGMLALAAGVCTIAGSMWGSRRGQSWSLALNGFASSALGLIFAFWIGPLGFATVALLMAAMAVSMGIYEWTNVQTFWRVVGAASLGFGLAFFALAFGWIKLNPRSPAESLFWLGSYFGLNAICMLGLALHWRGRGGSQSGRCQALPRLRNPKHAH